MSGISASPSESSLPIAKIVPTPPRTERWVLAATLAGLLLVAVLLVVGIMPRPQVITISFRNGHGLRTGDPIRHRGIDVGRAISVELDPSLASVIVKCELYRGAERLAREGSKFWIVRPSVSLAGIEGLETLVEGRYLSVLPGPESAEPVSHFIGLRESPGSAEIVNGGLEITLESPERFGLARGTPIYFRGMRVGEVIAVALSSDSLTVEARAVVGPEYRSLVRDNSVFWKDSGVNFHVGIRGLNLDMGTLESLAAGGVAFATGDPPGSLVEQGHRFQVEPKEVDDWREWRPKLVVGNASLPEHLVPPSMLHAEVLTTKRGIIGRRDARIGGWLLPLADGRIAGPLRLLELDESRNEDDQPPRLAFNGEELAIEDQELERFGSVVVMRLTVPLPSDVSRWPDHRLRAPKEPEDCLVVTNSEAVPLPLSRQRFSVADSWWDIDRDLAIGPDLWGAAVISRLDGCLIGLIDFVEDRPVVVPVSVELTRIE